MPTAVLLVQDPAARATLAACLRALSLDVLHAETAEQARERMAEGEGAEAAVLDLVLPGRGSGVELARSLRELAPRWPTFWFVAAGIGAADEGDFFSRSPAELSLGGLIRRPVDPLEALERLGRVLPLPGGDVAVLVAALPAGPGVRADLLASSPFDLAAVPATRLLVAAALDERTGRLSMDGVDARADLWFERGRIVGIDRAGGAFSLVSAWASPEAVAGAGIGPPPEAGDVDAEVGYLMAARLLPPHRVEDAFRAAGSRLVAALRALDTGAAAWVEGEPPRRRLPAALPPLRLLLDASEPGDLPGGAVLRPRLPARSSERALGLRPGEAAALQAIRARAGREDPVADLLAGVAGADPARRAEVSRLLSLLEEAGAVEVLAPPFPPESRELLDGLGRTLFAMERAGPEVVLGLGPDPTPETARQAFIDLSRRYHPDLYHHQHPRLAELARRVQVRVREAHDEVLARGPGGAGRGKDGPPGAAAEGPDPQRARIEFKLAEAALRNGKHEKALGHARRAARLDPDRAVHRATLGWAMFLVDPGAPAPAAAEIAAAVRADPRCDVGHLYLGHIAKRRQDWGRARACYQRAVRANPGCVEAQREIRLMDSRGQGVAVGTPAAASPSGAWERLGSLFRKGSAGRPAAGDDDDDE
ncbi:hypothetical protein L6R50_10625 [Myxococcota bacterium]|nr:hypothetical protein [Myxococcota bacterium]